MNADSIRPEKFTDPVILDLIEKITVEKDPTLARYQGASEIFTNDGRRFYKRIDDPHGVGSVPLTDKELEAKFKQMAVKYMSDEQIEQLIDTCWNAQELDNLGVLTRLMTFPGIVAHT